MAELQECFTDDSWKQSLQSEIITVLTESGQTQNQALEQVGYYYQCCAPSFLYKYYRDQSLNLDSVMSNKMWYSAPCNFNDAFDCDIAIDEQAIFNNLLPAISGGKPIHKGKIATVISCRGKGCRGKQRAAKQGHGKQRLRQAARRCPLQAFPFRLSTQKEENSIHLPKAEPSGKCRKAEYGHKIFST